MTTAYPLDTAQNTYTPAPHMLLHIICFQPHSTKPESMRGSHSPRRDVLERGWTRYVIADDESLRQPIVSRRQRLEAFLASRVPQLQLDDLSSDEHRPNLEVHTDRGHVLAFEVVVAVLEQNSGLPDAGVSDVHHLQKVVVAAWWLGHDRWPAQDAVVDLANGVLA